MALSNNPTPNELVKEVKNLDTNKQATLVSGTNIKTINNESILGSGNITIGGGGTATDVQVDSTSITSGGVANLVTKNGDYNASTNKFVTENDIPTVPTNVSAFTNDAGYLTSHQTIKTLDTTATTAQSTNASEAIAGSGTVTLHKVSKTGTSTDLTDASEIAYHDDSVTTANESTFADNYYTKTQCDNRYLLQSNEFDWTNLVTLYSTSSVSTGTKTLTDSLENYKLLIIGQYTTNSGGWVFQTIPRVLFDTLNSSSNMVWVTQYAGVDRRLAIYKVSNTQVYLYNVDNTTKVAIYGLK